MSAAFVIIIAGLIALVSRVRQVALPWAILTAVLCGLAGAGAVYAVTGGAGDTSAATPSASASSEQSTPSRTPSVPTTTPSASATPSGESSGTPEATGTTTSTTVKPTVAPPPACRQVTMSFTRPDPRTRIPPATDVRFEGKIACLPNGREVWLLSRTAAEDSLLYITKGEPVASANGGWNATASKLGDSSDAGETRTLFGVVADENCSAFLRGKSEVIPRTAVSLPENCERLPAEFVVRFAG